MGKGEHIIENHVSPDGRYVLEIDPKNSLIIHEFKIDETLEIDEDNCIVLDQQKWGLQLKRGISHLELAKRVKFESNNVIRFLTQDNRDILFEMSPDNKTKYLS